MMKTCIRLWAGPCISLALGLMISGCLATAPQPPALPPYRTVAPGDTHPDSVHYVIQRPTLRTPGTDRLSQQSRYQHQYLAQRQQVSRVPVTRPAPPPQPVSRASVTPPVLVPAPRSQPRPSTTAPEQPAPASTIPQPEPVAAPPPASRHPSLTRQDYRDRYQARQQQREQAAREAESRITPERQPAAATPSAPPAAMASLADQPVSPPSTTLNPRTVPAAPPRPQPAAPGTAQAAETVAALSQPEPETRSRRKPAAARPPLPAQAVASATPAPAPSGLNQGRSGENACGELTSNPLSQSSADKVAAQYAAAIKIPEQQAIRGDLVFFRTDDGSSVDHVGIYLGNNKFVHAPGAGKSITTDSLTDTWKVQFAGFGRLPASCRASIIPQP